MALLAEEIVEEWLIRQGYFTIRNLKHGNDEIDLLAIKHLGGGKWHNLHVEVQVSIRPVSYISALTPQRQTEFGISGSTNAKKRELSQLKLAVQDWVNKKFYSERKKAIRKQLSNSDKWHYLFVHGNVRHQDELKFIAQEKIDVKYIKEILNELQTGKFAFKTGVATDILELYGLL